MKTRLALARQLVEKTFPNKTEVKKGENCELGFRTLLRDTEFPLHQKPSLKKDDPFRSNYYVITGNLMGWVFLLDTPVEQTYYNSVVTALLSEGREKSLYIDDDPLLFLSCYTTEKITWEIKTLKTLDMTDKVHMYFINEEQKNVIKKEIDRLMKMDYFIKSVTSEK